MATKPRYYDARQLLALPLYLAGAIVWLVSGLILFIADKIGGSDHSKHLLQ